MLLAITPFAEFTQIIRVLLAIIVPVLALSAIATVWLHYKQKRKKRGPLSDDSMHLQVAGTSPESFCYNTAEGNLIYLDHTGLLREYHKKLSYSHARYAALEQDMKKLASKITGTNDESLISLIPLNNVSMENNSLPSQPLGNYSDEVSSKESSSQDVGYLNDLLNERKKQIEFLQEQIDLRIRNFHEIQNDRSGLLQKCEESERLRQQAMDELESLKRMQSGELENLRSALDERNSRLREIEQELSGKQDHIIYIENLLQELKLQNEMLNAAVADSEDKNKLLQQDLREEEARCSVIEGKLLTNRKIIQRLHTELSSWMQEEPELRPVIQLRPEYINSEWTDLSATEEETVVQ